MPQRHDTSAAEREAIDRFLAEKGARLVMSPEQVAALLRDAGEDVTIRVAEVVENKARSTRYLETAEPYIDGERVTMAELVICPECTK